MLNITSLLFLSCWAFCVNCQTTTSTKDSCPPSAVNNYYSYAPDDVRGVRPILAGDVMHQGPPGKSGVKGEQGLKGNKGSKGERGQVDDTANELQQVKEQLNLLKVAYDQLQTNFTEQLNQQTSQLELLTGEGGQVDDTANELKQVKEQLNLLKTAYDQLQTNVTRQLNQQASRFELLTTIPKTCAQVLVHSRGSGSVLINPNPTKIPPFYVSCDFSGGKTDTIINHDSTNEKAAARGCEPARCSKNPIRYDLTLSQIIAVINQSASCKQFVKYRCLDTYLHKNDRGAWLDRNGEPQFYWGGATSRSHGYCACGETGTCVVRSNKCNCDRNGSPATSDQGYLTDKDKLPVTELQFSDLDSSDPSAEYGFYTLGPLICTGQSA